MSNKDGKDYIYLIWKCPVTRRQYIVGQLTKNGQFEFKYGFEVEAAIEKGFQLLVPFDNINKTYKNDMLFQIFSSRLPDKKRKDIQAILLKYGLDEFDDYKLLKRSGARLPIDSLEFVDPIFDEEDVSRIFYLAGPRYYLGCDGENCDCSLPLTKPQELYLSFEKDNEHDPNAIKVMTLNEEHIGYVPRYYSQSIKTLIDKGFIYKCEVYDVQKDGNCNECIKIKLELKNN